MRKTLFHIVSALLLSMLLLCQASWAAKAYVTNTHELALRSGPSSDNKVTKMLKPGTEVKVLSSRQEWSKVRVITDSSGRTIDGWVLNKFLGSESPEEMEAKGIENENVSLKDRLINLEKEKSDLQRREKELTDKLSKIEASYEELKSGSTNYIKLKEENDTSKSLLTQVQSQNHALMQENENLRLSQKIKWFLMGAAVLFLGLFVGFVTGKLQKKRRVPYHI